MRVRGKPDLCRRDLLKVAGVAAALGVVPLTARAALAADNQKMKIGRPIAGDDKKAIEVASRLGREAGFEPVVVGGLEMGKYLMPGTPLAGEHTPDEARSIAATLKP